MSTLTLFYSRATIFSICLICQGFEVFDQVRGEVEWNGEPVDMRSSLPLNPQTYYIDGKIMSFAEARNHFSAITPRDTGIVSQIINRGEDNPATRIIVARDGVSILFDDGSAQVISSQPAEGVLVELDEEPPLVELE